MMRGSPRTGRTGIALLLMALAALAAGGPVGPIIAVDADVSLGFWPVHAVAYADGVDRTLSVFSTFGTPPDWDLYAVMTDAATGAAGPRIPLDVVAATANQPSVAWNPSVGRFFVVFVRNGFVRGLVLDVTGQPVGGSTPFSISSSTWQGSAVTPETPKVACDGGNWLVAWTSLLFGSSGLVQARVVSETSTNGAPVFGSPQPFDVQVATNDRVSSVAHLPGAGTLVTWRGEVGGIYGARGRTVAADGTLGAVALYGNITLNAPFMSSAAANPVEGEFLVAWEADTDGDGGWDDVFVRRVNGDGTPIGASPFAVGSLPRRPVLKFSVSAAWIAASNQYFVSWLEDDSSPLDVLYDVRAARLDADGAILEQGLTIANPALLDQGFFGNATALAVRGGDTEVFVQFESGSGSPPTPLLAQRYRLPASPNAPVPVANQFRLDGTTPIAPAGETNQTSFVVKAVVTDPNGDPIRLQVEVREVGTPFTGTPTVTTSEASSGSTVSLTIPSLTRGSAYHWQARAVDAGGLNGDWIAFQTDPDVPAETDLSIRAFNALSTASPTAQFLPSGGASVEIGGKAGGEGILLEATGDDGDGDDVQIEVEVRPVGQTFLNIPIAIGQFVPSGQPASVAISGLGEGPKRWQVRARDSAGEAGLWTSFGGNLDSEADFVILPQGSRNNTGSCVGSAGISRFLLIAWLLFLPNITPTSRR